VVIAQSPLTSGAVGLPVVLASLSLVVLAMALAWWLGLGISRDLVVASVRAAAQLLAVGLVFAVAFESSWALGWALLWIGGMIVVATVVVTRRAAYPIPGLRLAAAAAVAGTAMISVAVTFGFGVIGFEAVSLVVIVGITVGNAVPSAVLGVKQAVSLNRDRIGDLEALLALGLDRRRIMRFMAPRAARAALIPQIERTKVVGLIALPGAMTGLLLAGVDPVQAVAVQLLVMYLILGTGAVCVVSVVAVINRAALTPDLRVADWVKPEATGRPESDSF